LTDEKAVNQKNQKLRKGKEADTTYSYIEHLALYNVKISQASYNSTSIIGFILRSQF